MKLYFILAFFILLNGFFIISINDINMNSIENLQQFFTIYLSWFQQIGNNLTEITGDVLNHNWTP